MTETSKLAWVSLISSVFSVVFAFIPFLGLLFSINAIISGTIALIKINKYDLKGRELAILGIIFGSISLFLQTLVIISTLSYLGIFNIEQFETDSCKVLDQKIRCLSAEHNEAGIHIRLQNTKGHKMENLVIEIDGIDCKGTFSGRSSLDENEIADYSFNCPLHKGSILREGIEIKYTNPNTNLLRSSHGEITLKI